MKIIKWLLIISIIYIIFFLIKPINDDYCFFAGLVIGTIGAYYWQGGKDE